MIVAVDEVIPYCRGAFSGLGQVRLFSGRKLRPIDLRDADALIVRSVTRVDAGVLEGSSVTFVGSATIGMDHLDTEYLRSRGITYTNAAGSNANSVAEYVTAALLLLAVRRGWVLERRSLGIIGAGHVGSAVEKKARALGMQVLLCDPPLRESTGELTYGFLEDVSEADFLTLHVPLTQVGPYPTWHMIGRKQIEQLSRRQFLINTCRGPVIDEPYLKQALRDSQLGGAVLDVWEGEPRIDYDLLDVVDLGSAHIAGFSLDGKVRATEMIVGALCHHFGLAVEWDSSSLYPPPASIRPAPGSMGQEAIASVVLQTYNILQDDANLRALKKVPTEAAASGFDRLRNDYALRPEFHHFIVELPAGEAALGVILEGLGFRVSVAARQGRRPKRSKPTNNHGVTESSGTKFEDRGSRMEDRGWVQQSSILYPQSCSFRHRTVPAISPPSMSDGVPSSPVPSC